MNLSLNRSDDADPSWLDDDLIASLCGACVPLGPAALTVNLIVVDDAYIRELNREFRGVDRPTDVISFSYLEESGGAEHDDLAGEIYISHQIIEKEAKELGVGPRSLFLRVGVHGLLHVVGYEHDDDVDADRMEDEEKRILRDYLDPAVLETLF